MRLMKRPCFIRNILGEYIRSTDSGERMKNIIAELHNTNIFVISCPFAPEHLNYFIISLV